jgi:hypothetical protein
MEDATLSLDTPNELEAALEVKNQYFNVVPFMNDQQTSVPCWTLTSFCKANRDVFISRY